MLALLAVVLIGLGIAYAPTVLAFALCGAALVATLRDRGVRR